MIKYFAHIAEDLINECSGAYDLVSYRWEVLRVLAGRSHDVSDWSKTFNVDTLSFEELTTFVSVRDAMHKLALWIEIFDKDDVLNDTVFIKELTTLILPRIKALKQLDEV